MSTTITIHGKPYPAAVIPADDNVPWTTVSIELGITLHDYIADDVEHLVTTTRESCAIAGQAARSVTTAAMAIYREVTSALENYDAYWITTGASVRVHRNRADAEALAEARELIEGALREVLTAETAQDLIGLRNHRSPIPAASTDQEGSQS